MMKKFLLPVVVCLGLWGCSGSPDKKEIKDQEIEKSEVAFNNGDISFSGTLTVPEGKGKFPAVVLITGTGANSRDEEVAGFKIFKTLADKLTSKGIVVLRYDDRGVGGSSGDVTKATTEDFAKDVLAAVETLKNHPKVDPKRIGLLGHDEGGLVAPIAANESDLVDFIILMGTPSMKGDELLLDQQATMLRAVGMSNETIAQKAKTQKRIYDAIRKNDNWDEVQAEVKGEVKKAVDNLPENQRASIPDIDQFIDKTTQDVLNQVKTPWFVFFIDYDPTIALNKVKIPVLLIYGEKDVQVSPEKNAEKAKEALKGNRCVTVEVIPGANHLFQEANTGSPTEYLQLKKEFNPGFTDKVANWIIHDSKACKR